MKLFNRSLYVKYVSLHVYTDGECREISFIRMRGNFCSRNISVFFYNIQWNLKENHKKRNH